MVLYRFGSTGVVQVLSRAAELLGLVPVFPVRNIHSFASGSTDKAAFRDCVLVKKYVCCFSTSDEMADVFAGAPRLVTYIARLWVTLLSPTRRPLEV